MPAEGGSLRRCSGAVARGGGASARRLARGLRELRAGRRGDGGEDAARTAAGSRLAAGGGARAGPAGAGRSARLVYTVRRDDLQDHAGQISFPGGSTEPGDGSLLETALREAEEEIDLSPDLVDVVGELEEMYIPPSDFRVSPFVGLLPPEAEMVLAPDEVEAIFTVSLEELMAPETFRKVPWARDGRDYMVAVFAVEGPPPRNIWGATAAMTAALLARLGWSPP